MRTILIVVGIAMVALSLAALVRRDLVRLRGTTLRVAATVIGHRSHREADGVPSYAPRYRFIDERGTELEVVDPAYTPHRRLTEGTVVELTYPRGRPDLARPSQPAMWAGVYAALLAMLGILVALLAGWIA